MKGQLELKEKTELKDLGKSHTKIHLKRLFPFLENEYRNISEKELNNEETFKELFPDEDFDNEKLRQLFLYQN